MITLTKRQKEILDYITQYVEKKGYAPTFDEIKDKFNLSAISTVHEHITALVDKGYLERDGGVVRGLSIPKRVKPWIEVPLVGTIMAGKPIEAIEIPNEIIKIVRNKRFTRGELYALKVKGNSMIGDGIFDNDFVIVKKQNTAENGDTIVAIVDENEATLKRFYKEKGRIRLQPANPTLSPIYRKEVEIRGVVVKIIRNLKY